MSQRQGGRALRNPSWVANKVYLYSSAPQLRGWGFPADVRTLAFCTAFRFLGLDFELIPITNFFSFQHNHPIVELNGERYTDYFLALSAATLLSTRSFSAQFQHGNSQFFAMQNDVSTLAMSLSHAVLQHQWCSKENRNSILDALCSRRWWVWRAWAQTLRIRQVAAGEDGFFTLPDNAMFYTRLELDVLSISRHLESFERRSNTAGGPERMGSDGSFLNGHRPGIHDCITYAALKNLFDSPLPKQAIQASHPVCRSYIQRIEMELKSCE